MERNPFVNYVLEMNRKLTFAICVINVFVWTVSMVNLGYMSVMRTIYPITISAVRGVGTGGCIDILFHATVAA